MDHRTVAAFLCLALLLGAPMALSQGEEIETDVDVLSGDEPVREAEAGELLALAANVTVPPRENSSWRVFLNGTVDAVAMDTAYSQVDANGGTMQLTEVFNIPEDAEGEVSVDYELTVQYLEATTTNTTTNGTGGNDTGGNETTGNETSSQETNTTWVTAEGFPETGTITLTITAPPTPAPGPPVGLYVGGAVLGLLLIGAGVVAYLRWPRQYQHETGPRSRTLQEMEQEGAGNAAGAGAATRVEHEEGEPEVHPQLKILEARAKDVRRMIELARQRHERGDITEHQLNMIRDKKEAELQEIEEEMERFRSGDDQ